VPNITLATVLVPTHNHGRLLQVAVDSALSQTVADIEVFIVLDGPTPATRAAAIEVQNSDDRVRVFDNPKGARHGELHRHEALRHASGRIVCYLSDDDLWLPNHVANALAMLSRADFAHSLPTWVTTDGNFGVWTVDLASAFYRDMLLGGINRIPLTTAAHTTALYRRLPHGWRTTPEGTPTDLYMWQQILSTADVTTVSGTDPTALSFPAPERLDMTLEERLDELHTWEKRIREPEGASSIRVDVLDSVTRERAELHAAGQVEADRFAAEVVTARQNELRASQQIEELTLDNQQLVEQREETERRILADQRERETLTDSLVTAERQLLAMQASTTWRLRNTALKVPGVGRIYRHIARLLGRHA
jgi:hypothetical protein